MATKEQERAALAKIRKIVEGLGEESYVGQAMSGVFEDAEQNIDNDFWNSWRNRAEILERDFNTAEGRLQEKDEEIKEKDAEIKKLKELNNRMAEQLDSINKRVNEANGHATKNWNAFREEQDKVEALELEIIKLKAKLYDLMVK